MIRGLNRPACSFKLCGFSESWEKDIAGLAWVVVGELSIYEFLNIISSDDSIQPSSRTFLRLHEIDEAVHATLSLKLWKIDSAIRAGVLLLRRAMNNNHARRSLARDIDFCVLCSAITMVLSTKVSS